MNKFKVGDRVRYCKKSNDNFAESEGLIMGNNYVIVSIHPGHLDYVTVRCAGLYIHSSCFNFAAHLMMVHGRLTAKRLCGRKR